MSNPIAICLEDLDAAPDNERYLRCVALPGREPGLGLDRRGAVRWMPDGPTAFELWVSDDHRLVLWRNSGAPRVMVFRAGRSLDAPADSPVLLADQDRLEVSGRRLLVHNHGETDDVHEPLPLSSRTLARAARAAAAALVLGAALGAGGAAGGHPIQVRTRPPSSPAYINYNCKAEKLLPGSKGLGLLHIRCPARARLRPGLYGQVLDDKGRPVKGGQVVVKKVKGTLVIVQTGLKSVKKGTTVRVRSR